MADDLHEEPAIEWWSITPVKAYDRGLDLSADLEYTAPLNESGERCPWPWEPQQLVGLPIGQYPCRYCGAMVMAGYRHMDYREAFENGCRAVSGGAAAAGAAGGGRGRPGPAPSAGEEMP